MTCAKGRVTCTILTRGGESVTGENWCENPQQTCPRAPGEDYTKCKTVCRQFGHAEIDAVRRLREANLSPVGANALLRGHTYYCQACQEALFNIGVDSLSRAKA